MTKYGFNGSFQDTLRTEGCFVLHDFHMTHTYPKHLQGLRESAILDASHIRVFLITCITVSVVKSYPNFVHQCFF